MKKSKYYLVIVVAAVFFGLTFLNWFGAKEEYSYSERRVLADFPEATQKNILSGKFMTEFETYSLDQFAFRDSFRSLKAKAQLGIFRQKDNNDIYMAGDYVSKIEYPLKDAMMDFAGKKFKSLYDTYMAGTDVKLYFSIVPDKNYFLAEKNGYLALDYDELYAAMQERTDYMEFIDIRNLLGIEDYYRTDTHWKQECILDVAQYISEAMGNELQWNYEKIVSDQPFYGVYCGQSALNFKPDTLTYLNNDQLKACTVTSYDTGVAAEKPFYDIKALDGKDPYEMFLAGSDALLVIDNPNATTDKELIVFRDSFGSSLLPLMVESYAKVTVVDIRYISSSLLGDFIEFTDQDVLFLYSTLVLNSSTAFK